LYISTILQYTLVLLELEVLLTVDICESPLLGDDNLLTSGELVTGTAESLLDDLGVVVLATYREDDLANVDACNRAIRLAPGTTHAGLEPISSSTRQHLVDPQDVEGVDTNTQVERIFSRRLGDILVGTDTGCFECLRRKLLVLVRDEMAAEREFVHGGTFTSKVKYANLGIRDTTVVPGLGVGLVLAVAVAASGTATHLSGL
jgi:hypothetical protein